MTKEYQGFPIANFRTGFDEALEPWLTPRDAFQSVKNAHLYRGVIEKIDGYNLYADMSFRNLIVLSPVPDGVTTTFTGTLTSAPTTSNFFGYGAISVGSTAETFSYSSDASSTLINLVGSAGGTGTVNLSTLAVSLTFNAAPPMSAYSGVIFAWDSASTGTRAIMGIKPYYTSIGGQEVIVFDQLRVGKITLNQGILAQTATTTQGISEIPHTYYESAIITGNGMTTMFSGTLAAHPIVPGTVTFRQYTSGGVPVTSTVNGLVVAADVTDNGVGGLQFNGSTIGSINYATGVWTVTFSSAPATGNVFDSNAGIYGNLFTGSISNFFTVDNYQYKLFFTNSKDPIFYYDGQSIQYLNTSLQAKLITSASGVPNNLDITATLHLLAYRDYLVLLSPTVEGGQQVNAAFWSTRGNPLDFTNDDQEYAPTSQPIRTFSLINASLVVRFANSERILTFTNDAFAPFRWDATNNLWACDGPYSAINYDSWFSSVGKPAIVGSDGVNVKRADEIIPDFTDPSRVIDQTPVPYINQNSIRQCYGERFDDLKEGWLCYNSQPVSQTTVTASDNVLAFNYLDGTYAIYTFPFSCLGLGSVIDVMTWSNIFTPWDEMEVTWSSYQITENALVDLAGDQFDKVYILNSGTTLGGDPTKPVLFDVITKNFNPFIEGGQLARLGYFDLFVTANIETIVRVQFYLNDQLYIDGSGNPAGYYQETMLTFKPTDAMSPTTNQVKVWKRIYVGAIGKEHTIRIYQSAADFTASTLDQPVYIHAMVPYFKPAGRIFN